MLVTDKGAQEREENQWGQKRILLFEVEVLVTESSKVQQNVENTILGLGKGKIPDKYPSVIIIDSIRHNKTEKM